MTTTGQQNLRGIDIDKTAKGFADEGIIFGNFCTKITTGAREIRWYQKTAGLLSGSKTSGMTSEYGISSPLALPTKVEPNWTRNTSYVKKFIFDSIKVSDEDIRDSDPDVMATLIRDVTRAVNAQEDTRIFNVMTENLAGTGNINICQTQGAWNVSTSNPIADLLSGAAMIRGNGYDISDLVVLMNAKTHKNLMINLITARGSSIPNFSSGLAEDGVLVRLMNNKVVVSENVTANYAVQFVPQRACTLKTFVPITATTIDDPGIGRVIRVWKESEAILTDPKAVVLLSGVGTV